MVRKPPVDSPVTQVNQPVKGLFKSSVDIVETTLEGPPPLTNVYFRPDGISLYFRPDGESLYLRP